MEFVTYALFKACQSGKQREMSLLSERKRTERKKRAKQSERERERSQMTPRMETLELLREKGECEDRERQNAKTCLHLAS